MRLFRTARQVGTSTFESLLRPHVPYLYRLAVRFCGNGHDAEDLVQDLLIKLYPRSGELGKLEAVRPWLARALHNQYVDMVRKRARSPLGQSLQPTREAQCDPIDELLHQGPGPDEFLEQELTAQRLEEALACLSPEHRVLLTLHDIEGYTLQELTEILAAPLGTLKSRLHRARARLRGQLAGMEPFSEPERVAG